MAERKHKTMKEAQAECRKLRLAAHGKSPEADAIEAQWRADPDYEGDYAWLTRMQAGAHRTTPIEQTDRG